MNKEGVMICSYFVDLRQYNHQILHPFGMMTYEHLQVECFCCSPFSGIPSRQLPGSLIHRRRVNVLFAKQSESWTQDSMESKAPLVFSWLT